MIGVIARRELRAFFTSPQAWAFLGLTQLLLAWTFLALVDRYQTQLQPELVRLNSSFGVTDLVLMPFLGDSALLLAVLLGAALMSMRLLADERRGATLPLLLAAPVSSTEIVLGKYLAALGLAAAMLALWALMPLSLLLGTGIDLGHLAAALLGLWLLAAALMALALWISGLVAQPALAATGTFVGGLLLLVLKQGAAGVDGGLLAYLGLLGHYETFLGGRVATADIAYFLLLIIGLLALTVRRLDALRVQA